MKILLSLVALFPLWVFADVPAEQKAEVDHLITFVQDSSCKFKRNFSYHTGKEAADHINKKYDHFKDEINTTEDFIRLSASKSLLTGKAYKVKCGEDDLLESSVWLQTELKVFRDSQGTQVDTANAPTPEPAKKPAS